MGITASLARPLDEIYKKLIIGLAVGLGHFERDNRKNNSLQKSNHKKKTARPRTRWVESASLNLDERDIRTWENQSLQ